MTGTLNGGSDVLDLDNFIVEGVVTAPVELTSFSAEPINGMVSLNWQTAVEVNNDYFAVECSKDGQNFEEVGQVNGSGTTNRVQSYSYKYRSPANGVSYYRLK